MHYPSQTTLLLALQHVSVVAATPYLRLSDALCVPLLYRYGDRLGVLSATF